MQGYVIIARDELKQEIKKSYGTVASYCRRVKIGGLYRTRSYVNQIVNQLVSVSEDRAKEIAKTLGGQTSDYFYYLPVVEWTLHKIARLSESIK